MKSSKGKKSNGSTDANAMPVVAEVVPVGYSYTEPTSNDAAERIKHHLSQARVAANVAMRHIIEAGWELAKQKQFLGFGQWAAWCEQNIQISRQTADRYIDVFRKTIGAQRAQQSIGLEAKLLEKELDAVTVGMEEKTVRQAMLELGVIKRIKNEDGNSWGGPGRNQGRKPKVDAEAEELNAIANNPALLYAAIKGPLDAIWKLHSERDVFRRLGDDEFREVACVIFELNGICSKVLRSRGIKG